MKASEQVLDVAVRDWPALKAAVEAGGRQHIHVSGTLESTSTIRVPMGARLVLDGSDVHVVRRGSARRELDVCIGASLTIRGDWTVSAEGCALNAAPFLKAALGSLVTLEGTLAAQMGQEASGCASLLLSQGELILEKSSQVSGWVVDRPAGSQAAGAALRLEGPGARLVMNGGTVCHNLSVGVGEVPSPAVQLWDGAEFRMNGGVICENNIDGTAAVNGGGVYLHNASLVMNGGAIKDNLAYCGGGVYAVEVKDDPWARWHEGRSLQVNGGRIEANAAQFIGGGIYADGSIAIDGAEVCHNAALYGGGVYNGSGSLQVRDGAIDENLAMSTQYAGGGVYIGRYGSLRATGGSIAHNSCEGIGGGVYSKGDAELAGTRVVGNSAQAGGGLCNDRGAMTLSAGSVQGNRAMTAGGILNKGSAVIGGALVAKNSAADAADDLCNQEDATLDLSGCNVVAWYADGQESRYRDRGCDDRSPLEPGAEAPLPCRLHAEPVASAA